MSIITIIALSAAAPAIANAAPAEDVFAPIEIVASQKNYRLTAKQLRDAVETFGRERPVYAPRATLAFEPQGKVEPARPLRLRLSNGKGDVIDLTPDRAGRYTLPALDFRQSLWELRANRPVGRIRLRAVTISPDGSDSDRRLGDLRLNCRVMFAIVRHELSFAERTMLGLIGDPCKSSRISLFASTDAAIGTATLMEGSRRADVPVSADRRAFRIPTYRQDFSNEARFRLTLR